MGILRNPIVVLLGVMFLFSPFARGADSAWLLCDNGHIAVHYVEHRSKDGAGRVNSFSLVAGLHILTGDLKGKTSGHLYLSDTADSDTDFDGDVSVDYAKQRLSLKGDLRLNKVKLPLDMKLTCKKMTLTFD